ncbi:rhodanese-related sulfurtransferase [Xanthovirga aplysinae]|uniref:oxygen-dependent tRNA uridine(34) hydroxylase TrhO n=1 Tax=Xanthovirga aplysinae TaxID=2529853 RepID=UPI0012BC05FB|nr:rhodanese-related sulfurtransferase [Xanthovirga aplysinae]MTI31285.1 rhodanese-related sulfurtransferase [Xanthovirga aplysinae]
MEEKNYSILLYYCYTTIGEPEVFREEHHQLCLELGLLGRIIIAGEGLNGTVSGLKEDCEKYMQAVKADPRFAHTDFKVEPHVSHAFQKLYVRVKPEIVHVGLHDINPNERTGKHLEPDEFREMKDHDDVVILDVRSNYEHKLGKFKNALTLDIDNFREFPEKVKELEHLKDKKVLTYCTGGIKCEKASAFLLEQGFEDVYQLHGGIIKYGIEAGGEDFEGQCYVFDGRIAKEVNKVNPLVISECYICGTKSDRMVNCANSQCNIHVPICQDCGWEYEGACSTTCKDHPKKRVYDGTGYYQKEMNGYDPSKNSKRLKKDSLKA